MSDETATQLVKDVEEILYKMQLNITKLEAENEDLREVAKQTLIRTANILTDPKCVQIEATYLHYLAKETLKRKH